jgi:hypothetical protein
MTAPAVQNFTVTRGDNLALEIAVVDDASGAAKDISGASVRWWLAKTVNGPKLVEKTTADGSAAITNGAGGLVAFELVPADTAGLAGDYVHEAELVDTAGKVATVTRGAVTVAPDLVR